MNIFLWVVIASFMIETFGSFFDQSNFHFNFNSRHQQRNDDDEYYRILNLPKLASDREIKQAYHKKAMKMHPDRGGNEEQFKQLVEAYEVLSDKKKRHVYDKFGKAGLNPHQDVGSDNAFPEHFRDLFSGFGKSFSMPIVYRIEIPLEDFFTGRKLTIVLPGSNEKVILDVYPGLLHGSEIKGKLNSKFGDKKRDVIFILQEKAHPVFRRKYADLLMEIHISLLEALGGFQKVVKHLDGKEIRISSPENYIVQFDDVFVIEGMGMPIFHPNEEISSSSSKARGRLFVKVKVDMPESREGFSMEDRAALRKMLIGWSDDVDESNPPSSSDHEKQSFSHSEVKLSPSHVLKKSTLESFGEVGNSSYDEEVEDGSFSNPFGNFFI